MKKKLIKTEPIHTFSAYEFEGNIQNLITLLQERLNIIKESPKHYKDVRLDFNSYDDYGDRVYQFDVIGDREETDKEYKERIKYNKRLEEELEDNAYKEYLKLEKKFKNRKPKLNEREEP